MLSYQVSKLQYAIGFSLASNVVKFSLVVSNLQNNRIGFAPSFITAVYSFFFAVENGLPLWHFLQCNVGFTEKLFG